MNLFSSGKRLRRIFVNRGKRVNGWLVHAGRSFMQLVRFGGGPQSLHLTVVRSNGIFCHKDQLASLLPSTSIQAIKPSTDQLIN